MQISFTSPNEDELIAMANALSGQDLFTPVKQDNSVTIESFFEQLKSAVWVLLEKGIKIVILTVGSRGVFVCSKGRPSFMKISSKEEINKYRSRSQLFRTLATSCPPNMFSVPPETEKSSFLFVMHFPALPASVVRLTGCGDCLVGGMLASICAGLTTYQSTAIGIAAAKAAVETENNVPQEFHSAKIAGTTVTPSFIDDFTIFIWFHLISGSSENNRAIEKCSSNSKFIDKTLVCVNILRV